MLIACSLAENPQTTLKFPHVNIAGEVSQHTVILQSRIHLTDTLVGEGNLLQKDLPGVQGWGKFEYATDSLFENSRSTLWHKVEEVNDYILKEKITELSAGSQYFYRLVFGNDTLNAKPGRICQFSTLPDENSKEPVRFIMISCMNFEKFYGIGRTTVGGKASGKVFYEEADSLNKKLGFPAFETMIRRSPLFWIGNGDNVYYDSPSEKPEWRAKTQQEMRAKWHRQFSMKRLHNLFDQTTTYWLKDDHDYRFNDADTTNEKYAIPSHSLGITLFKEQVPITDPENPNDKTYRTYRVNKLLQIWMLEGRDYRSPNNMKDTPEKTVWGIKQKQWLKNTLAESDAVFKIIISPTPIVGPDDAYKNDNHTNPDGFQSEQQEFFDFLQDNDLINQVYILCGDRHWQYHSIHPNGLEEFSCGALVSQNARIGRYPGDPKSSDPEANIKQPYLQEVPIGGFLEVNILPDDPSGTPSISFTYLDEWGNLLYAARRYQK